MYSVCPAYTAALEMFARQSDRRPRVTRRLINVLAMMDYSLQQRHATGLEASGCTGVGGSWRHFNHLGYPTYQPMYQYSGPWNFISGSLTSQALSNVPVGPVGTVQSALTWLATKLASYVIRYSQEVPPLASYLASSCLFRTEMRLDSTTLHQTLFFI